MKSITKHNLEKEDILRLARHHFPEAGTPDEIRELKGGMFNSAYLVSFPGNPGPLVLKAGPARGTRLLTYEDNLMRTETAVMERLREETDIPVPRIVKKDFSGALIPGDYYFMTYLSGKPLISVRGKLSLEDKKGLKETLAGYFAQMHALSSDSFGFLSSKEERTYPSWAEAFEAMLTMILEDGRQAGISLPYERIESSFRRFRPLLEEVKEPALVDFDLWPGNIFVKGKKGNWSIEGIVDFERAFYGDPLADFIALMITGSLNKDLGREEDFLKAYDQARGMSRSFSREEDIRVTLYYLYYCLIMTVETYRFSPLPAALQKAYALRLARKALSKLESF